MKDRNDKSSFADYELSKEILGALEVLNYKHPTPIQQMVIPYILENRDVIAQSETGSGKTAAFAIPICEFADWNNNVPETLVLEPSRELAVQVKTEIFNIGRNKRLKVLDVLGGFPIDKQIQSLKQKTHIVVGTPGRVMDLVRRGSLKLAEIKHLVIDEADLSLDMGFMEEMRQIIEGVDKNAQKLLFSATINDELEGILAEHMNNPARLQTDVQSRAAATVNQLIYKTEPEEKYDLFKDILIQTNPDKAMIFCGTREMVNVLCHKLARDKIKCNMIHGELEQGDRLRAIDDFTRGRTHYMIATDVAGRGIDVSNLSHVFSYDFPTGRESYVHRIGRTGRNGATGTAISFVCPSDEKMLSMVEDYIDMKIPEAIHERDANAAEVEAFAKRQNEKIKLEPKKGAGFAKTITRLTIGGGKKSKMRAVDIVGTICSIEGITSDDIGIIDVRDSLTYVEILNKKGQIVLDALQTKTIKGKIRKVRVTR